MLEFRLKFVGGVQFRMLVAERLTKQYGALTAVRAVSFEARSGEVLGLLSPNGSGKSTTVKDSVANLRSTLQLPSLDAVFASLVHDENIDGRARSLVETMQQ